MANDRIWIRCTSCGERTLLTKHYPSCELGELFYSDWHYGDWMRTHLGHHPRGNDMHLGGYVGLAFEMDDPASGEIAELIVDLAKEIAE